MKNSVHLEPRPGIKYIREVYGNREVWRTEPDYVSDVKWSLGPILRATLFIIVLIILVFAFTSLSDGEEIKSVDFPVEVPPLIPEQPNWDL